MRGIVGSLSDRRGGSAPKTYALGRRTLALTIGFVIALLAVFGMAPLAQAASIAPVQTYYVPFLESDVLSAFQAIATGSPTDTPVPASPVKSLVTITAIGDNTIIYYDQWENGYDIDISNTLDTYSASNLDGTQIWGDNNPANGIPQGFTTDVINAGDVINLDNWVVVPRVQTNIFFDARDKIATTKTIQVTRTSWATASGTMLAGCVEVFDTNNWGTDYRMPVGTDLPDNVDFQMFEYSSLSIMAGPDPATITVDGNGDGDTNGGTGEHDIASQVLTEGQNVYLTGVSAGAHVTSDKVIQAAFITGDVGSNYESRDSALLPTNLWSNEYFTPVSTPVGSTGDARTTVWLYNPGTTALSVSYKYRNAAGAVYTSPTAISIPARGGGNTGVAKLILDPAVTGVQGATFYSSGTSAGRTFYAFSTTDSAEDTSPYSSNQAWDWSFTMIPRGMLTTQAVIGLGIGRDPTSATNPNENGNPVWVTPVGNGDTATNVYVDWDADPTTGRYTDPSGNGYDAVYSLRELDHALIYVPPKSPLVDHNSNGGTGTSSANTATVSHTTGSMDNRLMLVGVVIGNDSTTAFDVGSVTYGGTSLTNVGRIRAPVGSLDTPNSRTQVELWALANPPTGTADVIVTLASGGLRAFAVGVTTFTGADVRSGLTSALGDGLGNYRFASRANNRDTAQSVSVTTVANQVVYDVVGACYLSTSNPGTFTTTSAGQLSVWTGTARADGRRLRGAGSTLTAVGTSTLMGWSSSTSYPWAIGAVPINPVPGADNDQTGILVYTLNTGVKLAMAWGQDPDRATTGAPGLDVGTSIPPTPEFTAGKDGVLWDVTAGDGIIDGDLDHDGYVSPGDIIVYPITVENVSRLPVPNVQVIDNVPTGTTYSDALTLNSTVIKKDDNGDGTFESTTAIPDNVSPATAYPLDVAGYTIASLPVHAKYEISFRVKISAYADLAGAKAIINGGTAFAMSTTEKVNDKGFLSGRISDYVWYDRNGNGIQDAGEYPIGGVKVQLLDGLGNTLYNLDGSVKEVTTEQTGLYQFLGLPSTTYIVKFIAPEGMEFTTPNVGQTTVDVANDSDASATAGANYGKTAQITLGGGQKNIDIDAGLKLINPTLAVISSFGAYTLGGKSIISWTTASETNTAGYDVQRLDPATKKWVNVNEGVVPALFESPNGGTYSVVDASAQAGKRATYRLMELETSGATVVHGPYQVSARPALPRGRAYDELSKGATMARASKSVSLGVQRPAAATSGRVTTAPRTADRLRIQVTDSGLYKVVVADLVTGLRLTETRARALIRTKGLELTSRGKAVAYLPATDGSALYFYGKSIDSAYTSANVYWLRLGRGTVMKAPASQPVVSATASATSTTGVPTTTTGVPTTTTGVPTTTTEVPTTTTEATEVTTTTSPTSTTQAGAGELALSTEETEPTETTIPVTTTAPPEPEEAATSFVDSIHFEKELVDVPTLFHDPGADIWLWDYLVAGNAPLTSKTVSVTVPDVVTGRNLAVQLQGLVTTGKDNEHHVQVTLNGTVLGQAAWAGAVPHTVTFDIPAGVLQSGENQVQILALLDSGIDYSLVGLDSLDVSYERSLTATDDQLLFALADTGPTRVGGLTSSDAWILDLSNAALPCITSATSSGGGAGDAWVEFKAETSDYLVATASGALRPRAITAVAAPSLRSTSRGADYVVITSPNLAGAAGRLASYRTKDGFKTAVVTTSEIYDAFNYGIASPLAIKDFIGYAATKWRPAVRFVVLAGEGSYDYKDNLGNGDSLVPCVLIDSEDGLVASDVTLADNKGGDGVPEIAIGRIPAINETELDAAIAKIKAYEAAPVTKRTVLLAADNADGAGDFPADSNALASLIPRTVRVNKAYLSGSNTESVRSAVLSSFSSGTLLLNYVGHASVGQLAQESILSTADVSTLRASARLPIVTALTCVAGQYGLPGYDGLSEALTMQSRAGAIAMWAPTALEENPESVKLGKLFMKYLFGDSRTVRLGSVIQRTLKAGVGQKVPVGVLATYNLLGDPALKVRW